MYTVDVTAADETGLYGIVKPNGNVLCIVRGWATADLVVTELNSLLGISLKALEDMKTVLNHLEAARRVK